MAIDTNTFAAHLKKSQKAPVPKIPGMSQEATLNRHHPAPSASNNLDVPPQMTTIADQRSRLRWPAAFAVKPTAQDGQRSG